MIKFINDSIDLFEHDYIINGYLNDNFISYFIIFSLQFYDILAKLNAYFTIYFIICNMYEIYS